VADTGRLLPTLESSSGFEPEGSAFATEGSDFPTEGSDFPTEGSAFATEDSAFPTEGSAFATENRDFTPESADFAAEPSIFESVAAPPIEGITAAQLAQVVPQLPAAQLEQYLPALNAALKEFQIDTAPRAAAFLAQTAHESAGYRRLSENLNYSAQGLRGTWPSRFDANTAAAFAHQPEKIANRAYASRLGNGDEASGDGWRYRGRGVIQITGRSNYKDCGDLLGVDLTATPELLEQPELAFRSAGLFWQRKQLNDLADQGDMVRITKAINGGTIGLDERLANYELAKRALGIA
jgi:putative chitinase